MNELEISERITKIISEQRQPCFGCSAFTQNSSWLIDLKIERTFAEESSVLEYFNS